MRLRALRRLEEFEIKGEHKKLSAERKDLKALLKDEKLQWGKIAEEVQETKTKFGQQDQDRQAPHRARRRAGRGRACARGFRRARAGHDRAVGQGLDPRRQGPSRRQAGRASSSTRKATRRGSSCTPSRPTRCWCSAPTAASTPWAATSLPSARGHGEPVRLMIELGNEQDIVQLAVLQGRPQVPGGVRCRPRLHRARGRGRGADQERQAGAEPRRQGEGAGLRASCPRAPIRSRRSAKAASC